MSMSVGPADGEEDTPMSDINTTPLVDIMLVLLIIFLITVPVVIQTVPVKLPAVLAYNWLIRRNKTITEDLSAFTNDVHGYLSSNGAVKPSMAGGPAVKSSAQTKTAAAPTQRGAEPVRPGMTQTGAQADPTR